MKRSKTKRRGLCFYVFPSPHLTNSLTDMAVNADHTKDIPLGDNATDIHLGDNATDIHWRLVTTSETFIRERMLSFIWW